MDVYSTQVELNSLSRQLQGLREDILVKQTLYNNALSRSQQLRDRRDTIASEIEILKGAATLLQTIASEQQHSVLDFMNAVVTKGLQDVFGSNYRVEFKEGSRANQKTLDVVLFHNEVEVAVPDGVGGGVTQMISLLVQLIIVYLMRGEVAQIVILDESLSHLALVYVPNAAKVLRDISHRLNIQLILITHQEEMSDAADIVYELQETSNGVKAIRNE